MDFLVKGATDEPLSKIHRKPIKGSSVSRSNAPGAAQDEPDIGIRIQYLNEEGQPLKKGPARGLMWRYVNPRLGMDVDGLVVHDPIEVQIQDNVGSPGGMQQVHCETALGAEPNHWRMSAQLPGFGSISVAAKTNSLVSE